MSLFGTSFGKVNKHRRFGYSPLYYDKDKEESNATGEANFNFRDAYAREKGKTSPLAAFYSKDEHAPARRKAARVKKMVMLMLMFFIIYMIFGVGVHFYAEMVGVGILFILMVIFIKEVNNG